MMGLFDNITYYKKKKAYLPDNYQKSLTYVLNEIKKLELEAITNKEFQVFIYFTFYNSGNIPFDIYNFIRSNITYQSDPYDETLISPLKILGLKYGDCDDFALLTKSILDVLSIESRYLLLGKVPGEYTHIVVITADGIVIDPSNDKFNSIPAVYQYQKLI